MIRLFGEKDNEWEMDINEEDNEDYNEESDYDD